MASSGGKRCLYEVLNLPIDSTADQIRSAYRRAALLRHPDKLMQSGLSQAEATASFQELVNAYEVLSDPKERAWYDSHRSQILFSDPRSTAGGDNAAVPDLFSFFSNTVFSGYSDTRKGFYNVYSDVFDRVYANELNYAKKLGLGLVDSVKEAPLMGNLDSPYNQVTAFYGYWLGFGTVMDFCWVDQYDAMAGPNRKSRRVMEEENKKVRKKARREYNETVRGLAEFVKKRDKRVIDMQVKKGLELEKKRELEKEKKREMEKAKLERAMAYEEPEWAKADEEIEEFEDDEVNESEKRNELYCVVCGKKFKSEKQWKNHEQSKKHKEKVAELGGTFDDELKDGVDEHDVDDDLGVAKDDSNVDELKHEARNVEDDEILGGEIYEDDLEDYVFVKKDVIVLDELDEQFKDSCDIDNGDVEAEAKSIDEEVNEDFEHNSIDKTKGAESLGLDEEKIDLESMLSGRRNRKKAAATNDNSEKVEFMEYDNRKNTRRSKTNKKSKGMKVEAESTRADENKGDESSEIGESSSHDNEANGKRDQHSENDHKITEEIDYSKAKTKKEKELNPKSKHLGKGKKSKPTKKNDEHLCDTCGEDFESRNKLHRHLGETGHASLKYR